MCLMAKNDDDEDDGDDDDDDDVGDGKRPSYNYLMDLVAQAHKALFKSTKKVKEVTKEYDVAVFRVHELESELKELENSHVNLIDEYNLLVDENEKLSEKHKALEVAYESLTLEKATSPSSPISPTSCVTSSISISCEQLTPSKEVSSLDKSLLEEYHKLKEEREMVMDGFERLTRGRRIHKEILCHNLINNTSHKGLGSYPSAVNTIGNDDTIPTWLEPLMADDYFCDHCYMDGHTNRDCPKVKSSIKLPNANLFHENTHFKLFRDKHGKVKAKALGPPDKKRKVKHIWVPKCIVDLERATKLKWVPKSKT